MHQRFRQDYIGEFILVETVLSNNAVIQRREWVDNPIENHHISGRAAVIAGKFKRGGFTHRRLEKHRGGLLATKSLQTYGTGDTWRDMQFDFFLVQDPAEVTDMISQKYYEKSIIYSTTRLCINNPGCFYPVPYQPPVDALAQIIYLAAFDGHQEIFLLGYHGDIMAGTSNWITDVDRVIKTYPGTKFYIVGQAAVPTAWMNNSNFEIMDFRKFVSYCDI
jgi:hypothetical protein